MFQHPQTKLHKAIANVSKRPSVRIVDVRVDPEWSIRGEACIVFQDRGSPYHRPYTLEEFRARLEIYGSHEGAVGEGHTYRHVYFCADNVPADIRNALAAN